MIPNTEVLTGTDVPTIAGDHRDDDGEVFDSLVEPSAEPPTVKELPLVPNDSKSRPRATTRLLSVGQLVRASFGPVMILPADPDRDTVSLSVLAPVAPHVAAPYLRMADEAAKTTSDMGSFLMTPTRDLDGLTHTGPIYVNVPKGDEASDYALYVTVTAVVK